ncbi:MAG: hypothetical protein AVDCRST_MAG40-2675, partial [uncultured Gemmatimonadaceae bacterium]
WAPSGAGAHEQHDAGARGPAARRAHAARLREPAPRRAGRADHRAARRAV